MSLFTPVWLKDGVEAERKALTIINDCAYSFMIPFRESAAYQERWANKNAQNQKKLLEIAKNAISVKVRCAAIKGLEIMHSQVIDIAKNAETIEERCVAISKIDKKYISDLVEFASDDSKQISYVANKRLLEIAPLRLVTNAQMIIEHLEFRPRYFANKRFFVEGIKCIRELDEGLFKKWEQSYLDKDDSTTLLQQLINRNNEAIKEKPPCGTMMNRLSKRYNEITRCFDDTHSEILYEIEPFSTLKSISLETAALLLVIIDVARCNSKKDRRSIFDEICHYMSDEMGIDDLDDLDGRMEFYGEFVRGRKVRGAWWLGDEDIFNNPAIRAIGAYGDIVWNSAMIEDYDKSPVGIRGITDNIEFTNIILKKVYPIITELNNKAYTN